MVEGWEGSLLESLAVRFCENAHFRSTSGNELSINDLVYKLRRETLHIYLCARDGGDGSCRIDESGEVGDIPSYRCKAMSLSLTSISPENSPIALANIVYFSAAALVAVIKCHARREDDYASANAHSSSASCIGMVHYAYTPDQTDISIIFVWHKYRLFSILFRGPIALTSLPVQHGLQRPPHSSCQYTGLSLPARHEGSSSQPRHDASR